MSLLPPLLEARESAPGAIPLDEMGKEERSGTKLWPFTELFGMFE